MRGYARRALSITATVALVAANGLFLTHLIGLSYSDFSWKVLAAAYMDGNQTDSDGDGVADSQDPQPGFNDPSGCFYDITTGEIIPGGRMEATSFPGSLVVNDEGEDGCYQFISNSPGVFELSLAQVPAGCNLAPGCQPPPPAEDCPTGQGATCAGSTIDSNGNVIVVGALQDAGNPAFLEGAGCQPRYTTIDLTDGGDVLANNVALICDPQAVPAVSGWSWLPLAIGLLLAGLFGIQRATRRPMEA